MSESLAELYPTIMCKTELVSSKVGYVVEISKQSIENVATFLFAAYSKMWEKNRQAQRTVKQKRIKTWRLRKFLAYTDFKIC